MVESGGRLRVQQGSDVPLLDSRRRAGRPGFKETMMIDDDGGGVVVIIVTSLVVVAVMMMVH